MKTAWRTFLSSTAFHAFARKTCSLAVAVCAALASASGPALAAGLRVEDFRFDGPLGSDGARIERIATNHFRITLGHAPQHPDWANNCQFQITGNARGNDLRLEVVFEHEKPRYAFDEYFHSWSHDGKSWHPIQWEEKKNGKHNALAFPTFEQESVRFGLQVPMSYEDSVELMQGWAKHPHARLVAIGKSLGGRKIWRLEVTDPESPHPRGRRWVHYMSNQHPGEHNAQWRIAGAIDWLLGEAGADCRRRSVCYFILMDSPDSPSKGWYRVNAEGMDMNRAYRFAGADEKEQTREAFICQRQVEMLMASDTPPTDFWFMHTWGGMVDPIVCAGPEIGKTLGSAEEFIATFKRNDPGGLLKPVKIQTNPHSEKYTAKTGTWQGGIHRQFGATAVLCEGAAVIFTKQENLASGAVIMKSLAEYYSGIAEEQGAPRLHVHGRHLVTQEGKPFFWLADTAWELLHRLTREETDEYLITRAAQGFNVVQTVVLAEFDGLTEPNAYGAVPFEGQDPAKPNRRYFEHVDYVVRKANSLGIVVALLPTWGDKVRKAWGKGPQIFTAANAAAYTEFLGKRYKDGAVVWILGGDRDPRGFEDVWRSMARGLRLGDGGAHPITFHGAGKPLRGSGAFFHDEPWLGFNMYYSGHALHMPVHEGIRADYQRLPVKPTLDGEPIYENHPYLADGSNIYEGGWRRWDGCTRGKPHDVRRAAYWAMLAGAAGHTYGCHDVWQFYDGKRPPVGEANTHWRQALQFEGGSQMGLMRRFFESLPWKRLVPDDDLVAEGQGTGENHVGAARSQDGSIALVYATLGAEFSLDLSRLHQARVKARWFDPRNGQTQEIGSWRNTGSTRRFDPPGAPGRDNDWVLVIEAAGEKTE